MIDLHCHLLPGIDDGPETMEEALALAAHAVHSGIVRSVVTPHVHVGRYNNERASIATQVERFRIELESRNIPLQLEIGGEVRLGEEIIAMVLEERIPFLGERDGYRIMLLELPHSHVPVGSDKFVAWLLKQKIRPMIAHPERNKDVHEDINRITPLVSMGCWLQVTAGSVAGDFGEPSRKRAVQLLERGWVTVLASDAHNLAHRPPELEPGRRAAAAIVGEQESWKLVRDTPLAIVGANVPSPRKRGGLG
ncbi:MAG: CpsB/CapC family capsule biosynthesis tyrosine phosphatase [Burkholderiales bacterium]|jgi:protein-tyrosine phosphatase